MVLILLGDADHQAQVGGHHAVAGTATHAHLLALLGSAFFSGNFAELLHLLNLVGQLNFFSGSEQRHSADVAEIPAD